MSLVKSETLDSFEESVLHISELRRRNGERRTLDEPLVFERMVCEFSSSSPTSALRM